MFFTQNLLALQDTNASPGIATVWLLATLGTKSSHKKLPKRQIASLSIPALCDTISAQFEQLEQPLPLKVSSNLLYGVSLAYKQKVSYFYMETSATKNGLTKNILYKKAGRGRPAAVNANLLPISNLLNIDAAILGSRVNFGILSDGSKSREGNARDGGKGGGDGTGKGRARVIFLNDDEGFDISKGLVAVTSVALEDFDVTSRDGFLLSSQQGVQDPGQASQFNGSGSYSKEELLRIQHKRKIKQADLTDEYNVSLISPTTNSPSFSGIGAKTNPAFSNRYSGAAANATGIDNRDSLSQIDGLRRQSLFDENNDLLGDVAFEFNNDGELVIRDDAEDLNRTEGPEGRDGDQAAKKGLETAHEEYQQNVISGSDLFAQVTSSPKKNSDKQVVANYGTHDFDFDLGNPMDLETALGPFDKEFADIGQSVPIETVTQEAPDGQDLVQNGGNEQQQKPKRRTRSGMATIQFDGSTALSNNDIRNFQPLFDTISKDQRIAKKQRLQLKLQLLKGGTGAISVTGWPVNVKDIVLRDGPIDRVNFLLIKNMVSDSPSLTRPSNTTANKNAFGGIQNEDTRNDNAKHARQSEGQLSIYGIRFLQSDPDIELGRNRKRSHSRSRSTSISERNFSEIHKFLSRQQDPAHQGLTPEMARNQQFNDEPLDIDYGLDLSFPGFAAEAGEPSASKSNHRKSLEEEDLFIDYSQELFRDSQELQTPAKRRRTSSYNQDLRNALFGPVLGSGGSVGEFLAGSRARHSARKVRSGSRGSSRSSSRSRNGSLGFQVSNLQNDPLYELSNEQSRSGIDQERKEKDAVGDLMQSYNGLNVQVKRFFSYLYSQVDLEKLSRQQLHVEGTTSENPQNTQSAVTGTFVYTQDTIPKEFAPKYNQRLQFGAKLVKVSFEDVVPSEASRENGGGVSKEPCSRSVAAVAFSSTLQLATCSLLDISSDEVGTSYFPTKPSDVNIFLNY